MFKTLLLLCLAMPASFASANCDPRSGAIDIDACLAKGITPVDGRWHVSSRIKEINQNGDISITGDTLNWGPCRDIPIQVSKKSESKILVSLLAGNSCGLGQLNFAAMEFHLAYESYITLYEDSQATRELPILPPAVSRLEEWRK